MSSHSIIYFYQKPINKVQATSWGVSNCWEQNFPTRYNNYAK